MSDTRRRLYLAEYFDRLGFGKTWPLHRPVAAISVNRFAVLYVDDKRSSHLVEKRGFRAYLHFDGMTRLDQDERIPFLKERIINDHHQ